MIAKETIVTDSCDTCKNKSRWLTPEHEIQVTQMRRPISYIQVMNIIDRNNNTNTI